MSNVEHALDWSKLAELLPQLGREYRKLASLHRLILSVLALLPPLLIPLEAAKWFSGKPGVLAVFIVAYVVIAAAIFLLTGRWVENVRLFGVERIAEDRLPARMLDRIERDSGISGEMSFEEIYLTDGTGLERRTRKQIIYAENDIEVNMDRGQKLFANNNIPLKINTGIVIAYCLFTITGAFYLPYDDVAGVNILMYVQYTLLMTIPAAIYYIQSNFRQHLLNEVLAAELLDFITDDDAREGAVQDAGAESVAGNGTDEQPAVSQLNRGRDDSGEEGIQAQA